MDYRRKERYGDCEISNDEDVVDVNNHGSSAGIQRKNQSRRVARTSSSKNGRKNVLGRRNSKAKRKSDGPRRSSLKKSSRRYRNYPAVFDDGLELHRNSIARRSSHLKNRRTLEESSLNQSGYFGDFSNAGESPLYVRSNCKSLPPSRHRTMDERNFSQSGYLGDLSGLDKSPFQRESSFKSIRNNPHRLSQRSAKKGTPLRHLSSSQSSKSGQGHSSSSKLSQGISCSQSRTHQCTPNNNKRTPTTAVAKEDEKSFMSNNPLDWSMSTNEMYGSDSYLSDANEDGLESAPPNAAEKRIASNSPICWPTNPEVYGSRKTPQSVVNHRISSNMSVAKENIRGYRTPKTLEKSYMSNNPLDWSMSTNEMYGSDCDLSNASDNGSKCAPPNAAEKRIASNSPTWWPTNPEVHELRKTPQNFVKYRMTSNQPKNLSVASDDDDWGYVYVPNECVSVKPERLRHAWIESHRDVNNPLKDLEFTPTPRRRIQGLRLRTPSKPLNIRRPQNPAYRAFDVYFPGRDE